jgi:YidC/Oxa1 family membrane protein insertase
MSDQRNLILAIALSVAIIMGFQFFFAPQRPAPTPKETPTAGAPAAPGAPGAPAVPAAPAARGAPAVPGAPSVPGAASAPAAPASPADPATVRTQALAKAPRVSIKTPSLHGSISLQGGRIDDLTLAHYRETIDPKSPEIRLLSPSGAPGAYFAEFGLVAGGAGNGARPAMPGPDTVWSANATELTPQKPVTLNWDNGQGLKFSRTISVDNDYMFTVTQKVENTTAEPVTVHPYGLITRYGTPPTLGFYVLHEGPIAVLGGTGDQKHTLQEHKYDDLQSKRPPESKSLGGWLGITDKYWLAALVPDQTAELTARFQHAGQKNTPNETYQTDYLRAGLTVAPGASAEATDRLFAGAKVVKLIDGYEKQYNIALFDLSIDWGWFYWITRPLFWLLDKLFVVLGNFGLAILALTVLVKLAFFPLANKSYAAMSKMKDLQPEMMKMRERFGDDKQRLNQELMALYRKEKVNPASGCLPIIIQIPVFFALYKVLFVTIEMRHAPFYGWIKDLSAQDPTSWINAFGLLPWGVPDLGPLNLLNVGVWPIIMGGSMYLQQKLNPQPPDPVQARIFLLMPFIFTFMLAQFAAGLVIYWTWNNLLSIAQQWVIIKKLHRKPAPTT